MEPLYEKAKQKEDKLLRISYMLFDYKNNILPPWQPHQRDPRTCCHHHLHEKIELLYFIEGTVIFRVDGTPYTCNPGDFLIVNPFEPHSGVTSPECDVVRYYAFNLDCSLLKKLPVSRLSEIFDPLLSGSAAYPHTLPATDPAGRTIREELDAILATRQTRNAELYQIASVCRIVAAPRPAEGRARRISCGAVSFIFRATTRAPSRWKPSPAHFPTTKPTSPRFSASISEFPLPIFSTATRSKTPMRSSAAATATSPRSLSFRGSIITPTSSGNSKRSAE